MICVQFVFTQVCRVTARVACKQASSEALAGKWLTEERLETQSLRAQRTASAWLNITNGKDSS